MLMHSFKLNNKKILMCLIKWNYTSDLVNKQPCVSPRDEDAPAKIEDPDALKPEGWLHDEKEFVPDPNAEKPEDW